MRKLEFTPKDQKDLAAFRTIVRKPDVSIDDITNWVGTVTNPSICTQGNIVVTKKGNLSVRNLTAVLAPIYREERTKVMATLAKNKKVKTKRLKKPAISDKKMQMAIKIAEILNMS